jgi:hypothetical protein
MKWLEIIELRSVYSNQELLESKLQKLFDQLDQERKKQEITAYTRLLIDTDFSIHLSHDSKKVEKNGSPLGLRIASALKEFGSVNHSIWIEMQAR